MHRCSYANIPGMERKALIRLRSGVSYRIDMPLVNRKVGGEAYFRPYHSFDFDPHAVTP
jgi:hypothetical protein